MALLWYSILVSSLAAVANAQGTPCYWWQPRAAVVRDSIYFDGGIWATKDGYCLQGDGIAQSKLNFSTSFDSTSNFTELLGFQGAIQRVGLERYYFNGFMFADNDEYYTFGGMATKKVGSTTDTSGIAWNGLYPSNDATTPSLGLEKNYNAQGNFTHKAITNGAGVNIPSEQVGFYFSGLEGNGPLSDSGRALIGQNDFPARLVNTMLMVNMTKPHEADWTEFQLPDGIARAEATLAFVPVGRRGVLVVMGGVAYPADVFGNSSWELSANYTSLNDQADSFMTTVSIYDIDSRRWYSQATNGGTPTQLAQSCAVVASAPDNSTHHIYLYGGYPGGVNRSLATDDVWILSVPSFTWLKVPSDNTNHRRMGHVCAKPYPDQMMVIGGIAPQRKELGLARTAFADVFNLTSLQWTGKYDPTVQWYNYSVPSAVKNSIPVATPADINNDLRILFRTPYPGKQVQYYPYSVRASNDTVSSPTPQPTSTNPGRPGWVIPVAVVVPIVACLLIGLGVFCCIRRRRSNGTPQSRKSRVNSWLIGTRGEKSVRSDDDTTQVNSVGIAEADGDNHYKNGYQTEVSELHSPLASPTRGVRTTGSGTAELHSHSVPAELPTDVRGGSVVTSPEIRNHPYYPLSISGHGSTNPTKSVSSPTSGPITPYELPQNRSKEKVLAPVPNDMILDQVQPRSPQIVPASTTPHPSRMATTADTGDVSPELRPVDDDNFANNPPQQRGLANAARPSQRPAHHRHTSSMSSDFSNVSNASPSDEHHRSMTISPIPNSPSTVRTAPSPTPQSPDLGSGSLDQPHAFTTTGVRRKEIGTIPRKVVGSGPAPPTTNE